MATLDAATVMTYHVRRCARMGDLNILLTDLSTNFKVFPVRYP